MEGQEIFSLACVYDSWVDNTTGELRETFSILTTEANPLMQKIHNVKKKMPLILAFEDEAKWINPKLPVSEIKTLIKPYSADNLLAVPISMEANSPKVNRNKPEILLPVEYPELALFD